MKLLDRIAIVQFNPVPGAITQNARRIIQMTNDAKNRGAAVVVFPEASLTGYCISDLQKNSDFMMESRQTLTDVIAPAIRDIALILGYLDINHERTMPDGRPCRYNSWALVQNGEVTARGNKSLLIDDGVLDDSRYYLPGRPNEIKPVGIQVDGEQYKIGILVCQDMWDDDAEIHPAKILAGKGAELLIALNSSPFYQSKMKLRTEIARARVEETGIGLLYVNTTGAQDNGKNIILFDGGSFFMDKDGKAQILGLQFEEQTIFPLKETQSLQPIEELYWALVMGIRDFYRKTAVFDGALIGLSGGIDSAVDACLLVEALGRDKVTAVNMPSAFNSDTTRKAAKELADALDIEYFEYPIQQVVDAKVEAFKQSMGRSPSEASVENIQARERGNILMTIGQERNLMVVGNGNKTELQRGYATLYGDIVGAIMPLGDVHKLAIYELGVYINKLRGHPIPSSVFEIKPSAELSAAHNVDAGGGDPFDYYIESPLGVELIENDRTPSELKTDYVNKTLDPKLWIADKDGRTVYDKLDENAFLAAARDTEKAIRASYFKRVQSPPIITVSRRSFGFDYRETLLTAK